MIPDLSTWTPDEKLGLGMIVTSILLLVAWACFVIESRTRALGNGRRVPVVPLEDLLHEQASAEAYDDTLALFGRDEPDMDVEAGIVYGASSEEREAWVDEWNAVYALKYEGGAS